MANSSSKKATLLGQCFSQHFNLSESLLIPDDITHSDLSVLEQEIHFDLTDTTGSNYVSVIIM